MAKIICQLQLDSLSPLSSVAEQSSISAWAEIWTVPFAFESGVPEESHGSVDPKRKLVSEIICVPAMPLRSSVVLMVDVGLVATGS